MSGGLFEHPEPPVCDPPRGALADPGPLPGVDFYVLAARRLLGLGADCERYTVLQPNGAGDRLVKLYRRGTTDVRSVTVSRDELNSTMRRWEQHTGKCAACLGEGRRWRGWRRAGGSRFEDCEKCRGSGGAEGAVNRPADG